MKKICVALTNRTNYSKLKTVLFELRNNHEVDFKIVLSSTILLDRYGSGYKDLLKDGFNIDRKIDCTLMNDSHESMAKTVGLSVIEHASYFQYSMPDLLLIVGDRFDMLAPSIAASMMNIPIAHIQGGELSGTIDNVVRDVITRFASLHFVSTEISRNKLENFGVDASSIFNFGCPAVEYVTEIDVGNVFDSGKLGKSFKHEININPDENYFLVMIHPDTTNGHDVDMDAVMQAVASFGIKALIFYPNVDANNSRIVSSIAEHKNNPNFYMIRHMPLEGFIHAMAHCVCMISNSSSGIREAGTFGIPVINVGHRQADRERNLNVVDVGDDYINLRSVIGKYMGYRFDPSNIYFRKGCSKNIARKIVEYIY